MAHIVAQPCFGCKYTDCVVVCPVECFYEGEQILYIHPEECIDCEACVPECPVEAIFHEDNLPEEWADFKQLNAEMAPQCSESPRRKSRCAVAEGPLTTPLASDSFPELTLGRWWSAAPLMGRQTGNPVRIRNGPAAVTEDRRAAHSLWPLSPRVRREGRAVLARKSEDLPTRNTWWTARDSHHPAPGLRGTAIFGVGIRDGSRCLIRLRGRKEQGHDSSRVHAD